TSTHINHLTPRVLDIDDLYERMEALGITMIDEVQGPPAWDGPDVLLRQTSFRALNEERIFKFEDGTIGPGELRVRFGEVEQRGIALTPKGRELYDQMLAETDRRLNENGGIRTDVARQVWAENLPDTEHGLAREDLAFFTYRVADDVSSETLTQLPEHVTLVSLIDDGIVIAEPIVYEDFLPRSAAGIFQSNLTSEGSRDDALQGTDYDIDVMSEIVGRPVADPHDLYRKQQDESLAVVSAQLDRVIDSITANLTA
ncbi:MAG: VOC family protein, partial [Yaniella sp.]|uniref:2-oxoadipate dioxygenase/decarboxylase family protein n=1 Tax=Yaniella sp. TaxID=2773929 RepID=UPI00264A1E25